MKLWHLVFPIALFVGYNHADILDTANPFIWSLQPPAFIHKQESVKGMKGVKQWKRQQMLDATKHGSDIPVMGLYPCKTAHRETFICDYRK